MTPQWVVPAIGAAVIICAIISGVFLAFSDFVMRSLAIAPPSVGVVSMQLINRKVYGSLFLVLLMGFSVSCLLLAYTALTYLTGSASSWVLAGSGIYLTGVFLVTVVFNVPMNKQLDVLDHSALETVKYWKTYASSWTMWNHIRTLSSAVAAICFLVASLSLAGR